MEVEGLKIEVCNEVYPPSDDTYVILDAIKKVTIKEPILEVGTGTGIVALSIASGDKYVVATDISIKAVKCAWLNAKRNSLRDKVDVVLCDLSTAFRDKAFSFMAFNPPYLPVMDGDLLGKAWSGGLGGVAVVTRFLRDLVRVLRKEGRALLLQSSISRVDKVLRLMRRLGLKTKLVVRKRMGLYEDLMVLSIVRGEL